MLFISLIESTSSGYPLIDSGAGLGCSGETTSTSWVVRGEIGSVGLGRTIGGCVSAGCSLNLIVVAAGISTTGSPSTGAILDFSSPVSIDCGSTFCCSD